MRLKFINLEHFAKCNIENSFSKVDRISPTVFGIFPKSEAKSSLNFNRERLL